MTDQQLLSSFRHEANGDWTCIKPILLEGTARKLGILPGARIRQADFIQHMHIARELDEAEQRLAAAHAARTPIHH